jgi:hypothetical protein
LDLTCPNGDTVTIDLMDPDPKISERSEVLTPGIYTFDVDVSFSADIAFRGSINDVFIIQTTGNLLQAEGTRVALMGGAQANNIFWQIAGQVSMGAGSEFQGVLLVTTDVACLGADSVQPSDGYDHGGVRN